MESAVYLLLSITESVSSVSLTHFSVFKKCSADGRMGGSVKTKQGQINGYNEERPLYIRFDESEKWFLSKLRALI